MKLQEYFTQQKSHWLSDVQRIEIYQMIMEKNMKKSFQRKRSFLHIKSFVYTSFLLFFIVGFYWMYFFQEEDISDMNSYLISSLSNTNVAQADFIAKIVDFNGTFFIEQSWKSIQTSNIKDWDIVVLNQNAQMIFHIDNDTKAKITGPAKFMINKKSESGYRVILLQWEYLEVSSLKKENTHNIEVSIDNILVSQWENKKPINFQIAKQGKNHVIKNNWAKLVVTSEDKKSTSLSNKQVLSLEWNDISVFDSFEKFTKAIKNENISKTFTFVQQIETDQDNIIPQDQDIKILNNEEILNIDEKDSLPNIDIGLVDNQKVITPDQIKVLEQQLYKQFLQENINQLNIAYKESNQVDFENYFDDLEKKISKIAWTFGYEYNNARWSEQEKISKIIVSIQNLADHINKNYLLPPKYVDSLKSILPPLSSLKNIPFDNISQ